MKTKKPSFFIVLYSLAFISLASLITMSCNDQGTLGEEVIDSNDISFTKEEYSVPAINRQIDSFLNIGNLTSNFLIGRHVDPVFGELDASFFVQMSLLNLDVTFENATVDSVYFELLYDTLRYGNESNATFDLYVHRILENPDLEKDYYSNESLDYSAMPIGKLEDFTPKVYTSDSANILNILRVPLDLSFGEDLISFDPETYTSSISFQEAFKGIYLKGSDDNSELLSFFFDPQNRLSRIIVHYTQEGDQKTFSMSPARSDFSLSHIDIDNKVAEINDYIDDADNSQSQLFVGGLGLAHFEVDMSDVSSQFNDQIINRAELCFFVSGPPYNADDEPLLSVLRPLFAKDETLEIPIDVLTSNYELQSDSLGNQEYCLDITLHFQDIIAGRTTPILEIHPNTNANNPRRTVLNGFEQSNKPSTLRIFSSTP